MLVDGAGLEARENIEREAQEAHGTEGHVVGDLIGLLVRHLPSMRPAWRRFYWFHTEFYVCGWRGIGLSFGSCVHLQVAVMLSRVPICKPSTRPCEGLFLIVKT